MRTFLLFILMLAGCITRAQQSLQLQPAIPAFLRNGDRMELQLTIQNTGTQDQTGQAELQLTDAETGVSIDGWFQNVFPNQYFTAEAKQAAVASFPIEVPYQFFKKAAWRFIVRTPTDSLVTSGSFPILPVLQPFVKTALFSGSGPFTFTALLESGLSDTRQNAALHLQMAAAPAVFIYASLADKLKEDGTNTWAIASQVFAATLLQQLAHNQPEAFKMLVPAGTHEVQQVLKLATTRLGSLQQDHGGFSLLPDGKADAASTWQVALTLARLQELKAPLSKELQQALTRSLAYLKGKAPTFPAVALTYLESLAGGPQSAAKRQVGVSAAPDQQPRWIQAMTAVCLFRIGKKEQAAQVYRLAGQQNGTDAIAEFQLVAPNSLLLEYAQLTGDTAAIRMRTAQLLGNKTEDPYQFTGNAYALLLGNPVLTPAIEASVQVGKLPELRSDGRLIYDTTIAGTLVQPSLAHLMVRSKPAATPFTRVQWKYVDEPEQVSDSGLTLTRTWQTYKGCEPEPLTEGLRVAQGQDLVLTLEGNVSKGMNNLLLSVSIPAGFEPTKAQHAGTFREGDLLQIYFPYLASGKYYFSFEMKAVYKGSFGCGPVMFKSIDTNKIFARLNNETVVVE